MYDTIIHGESFGGAIWTIGWLFSIGYLGLSFWRGVLAIIIWPFYLGKHFSKRFNPDIPSHSA